MKFVKESFLFFLVVALILAVNLVQSESDEADCPDSKAIEPCTCDRQGFSCYDRLDDTSLVRAFRADFKYKAYRSVWINGTPLKKLPKNVFNGYRISKFSIEQNELEIVEEGAFNGSYDFIYHISLYDNQITSFPFYDLAKMEWLAEINLALNNLTSIPENAFSSVSRLERIDLSRNQIEFLGPGAFDGLQKLRSLELNNNKIKTIPGRVFAGIPRFPALTFDLAENEISHIDPTAFLDSAPFLINLSNNKLEYLDPEAFETLVMYNRTSVEVEGNPLTCHGCSHFRWLLNLESASGGVWGLRCVEGKYFFQLTLFDIGCVF